jgi:pimeloyl-ACP methyl ester carboxylesterase
MDELEVRGHRIAYEKKGEGLPLVLLHGWPMDGREWRRQIDGVSDEFTVVAWNAPGAGRSSDPPETFRLPDWADCLAAFIEALGLGRSHVGGVSWGGGLALELYRRHPGVVRTLILPSSYAGWAGSLPTGGCRAAASTDAAKFGAATGSMGPAARGHVLLEGRTSGDHS